MEKYVDGNALANHPVSKNALTKFRYTLQISEANIFCNPQTFGPGWNIGRMVCIAIDAVGAARRDDFDRRFVHARITHCIGLVCVRNNNGLPEVSLPT